MGECSWEFIEALVYRNRFCPLSTPSSIRQGKRTRKDRGDMHSSTPPQRQPFQRAHSEGLGPRRGGGEGDGGSVRGSS